MSCVCPVSLLSCFIEAKSHQDRGLIEAQCRRPERRPTQVTEGPLWIVGSGCGRPCTGDQVWSMENRWLAGLSSVGVVHIA